MAGVNFNDTDSKAGSGSGAGISNIQVEETVTSTNFTVTAAHPTYATTGITDTITTLANERVEINFNAIVSLPSTSTDLFLGYTIDGGAVIPVNIAFNNANSEESIAFREFTGELTAGLHTIDIVACSSGGTDPVIYGTSTAGRPNKLQLTRYLNTPALQTYTPVLAYVGGSGNVVPVYTVNKGEYVVTGKSVSVVVELSGDGGAEGAGTGLVTISLPVISSSSHIGYFFPCGYMQTSGPSDAYQLIGTINPSESVIFLAYITGTTRSYMVGSHQSGSDRAIILQFTYRID